MWPRAIAGVVLIVVGGVWAFQGFGVLHGSPMTGHAQWIVFGALLAAFGAALLRGAARLRRDR